MSELPPVERVNYFSGEALLTGDFVCEQHYNIQMRTLLNSSLHTWGIASGLLVSWQASSQSNQVRVSPGMAIDELGRQIVLSVPQIVALTAGPDDGPIYLTIRYNEVYADYSVDSGVPGYKRIVQQPLLEQLPTLQQPGINILLAVVSFSPQGNINDLIFKQGNTERRYVGSRLGLLELVTEGSGSDPVQGVQLQALRDQDGKHDYLDVTASRSQFNGMLTTRDNLGIGVDFPKANLELARIVTPAPGTLKAQGTTLFMQPGIFPPLQPGDVVIPQRIRGTAAPTPGQAVIAAVGTSARQGEQVYKIQRAFANDMLVPVGYGYIRTHLVRFLAGLSEDPPLEIFRIDNDGNVGLGLPAAASSGKPGPAALRITPERKVGIGFDDAAVMPQEALEVNGTVKALSFEGNGSKLENLPILSYWTKQNPTAALSPIYYNQGNVGVLMTHPPASLSVGTGDGLVGNGMVSADAVNPYTQLNGFSTTFTSQIGVGDTIVLGYLKQQWRQIKIIHSKTQLELNDQFPIILEQSSYSYAPADSNALPSGAQLFSTPTPTSTPIPTQGESKSDVKPGQGTISSNGTMITGSGTDFSSLQSGDWLMIDMVKPDQSPGSNSNWQVRSVDSDTQLTLVEKRDGSERVSIPANLSAYMVLPALLGLFQSTVTLEQGDDPPPPAMLVLNNGPEGEPKNTVAINMPLNALQKGYALEVNGDVNFNGGSSNVDHLVVRQTAQIGLQNDSGTVLTVGSQPSPQLLTVTQNNVVIGVSSGSSLLEVGGALTAASMTVAGVAVAGNGSVSLLGKRVAIPISAGNPACTGTAATDGLIVVSFGPQQLNASAPDFFGMLSCTLGDGSLYKTCASYQYHQDENGAFQNPVFGSLNVPVCNGETWNLQLDITWSYNCSLFIQAYWVPFGPDSAAT
ncbi:hypothetical protein EO087_14215 [Dyella sp. M7H15-1]|uniref:hypothetical protein n=1 Tax=Dyella sp. M7H15-1 TaxID=2501295 RepID=UPI00100511B9|nr:hypothetical protein [Dyella sp. M7H15-1]QAU25008.1 hypothetical protein EO087_14215 [Dyella sp. M7H15-1]